jgi:hypothetical protein
MVSMTQEHIAGRFKEKNCSLREREGNRLTDLGDLLLFFHSEVYPVSFFLSPHVAEVQAHFLVKSEKGGVKRIPTRGA